MNSPREFSLNGLLPEDSPSGSSVSASDNNANLSNTNQNKGAIPKTKTPKPINTSKKPTKLNNNVDDILISKSSSDLTDGVLQMHSDVLRLNGFSDQLSRISTSYLDDYNTTLFTNGSDNCENCSGRNKTNIVNLHENHFNHDVFTNTSKIEENGTSDLCKISSYQPSTSSSREIDSDIHLQLKLDTESSSSEDNELLSISDDGCIYTYKGDHVADLPSSFFSLDIPPSRSPEVSPQNRQENTSPEMDFLEMDFDPGPSGDADSDSQSNADLEGTENLPQDPSFKLMDTNNDQIYSEKKLHIDSPAIFCKIKSSNDISAEPVAFSITQPLNIPKASTSGLNLPSPSASVKQDSPISSITERIRKIRMPWLCSISQRTTSKPSSRLGKRHHSSTGELTSPSDRIPSPCEDFERYKFTTNDNFSSEKVMIWSEEEAYRKQITQIGASACGATALLNVLNALRFPVPSIDTIQEAVKTRLRANCSPLTEYLLSRSNAGSSHEDLIEGLEIVTDGQVYARFFHMYPERIVNLNLWLSFWITHGAVPIATLNLQKCSGTIPDAWHHQMIFGVGPRGIYLTNPLECVEAGQLWPQLSSESILLIRREDILSRWNIKTDLNQLMKIKDSRWSRMNVLGQVANMVRENVREKRLGFPSTSHIKVPAAYSSGITLAMRLDAPLCPLLMYCPELPILPPYDEATGYSDNIYY